MPRGSKAKYTDEQKRKAAHIEDSYEHKGLPKDEAEARAWATVNKQSGGGEKTGGSGRRKAPAEKARTGRNQPSAPLPAVKATRAAVALHWVRRPRKA